MLATPNVDQYRTAFRMFGSPQDGISKEGLKFRLRSMNIVISDAEIDRLFNMTDLNRNGKLEFSVSDTPTSSGMIVPTTNCVPW